MVELPFRAMDIAKPSTAANLEAAFGGESMANRKYLFFAEVAKQVGHSELAKLFRDTAAQETEHAFAHFRLLHPELVIGDPATLSDGQKQALMSRCLELAIEGGCNLLSALSENNITLPASCGGKGMCGYCKVRVTAGGGELLPTELPFLTRRDIATGIRLACQVKIRQDIHVSVPDFLDVVADMVRTGTFDKHAHWRFSIKGEEHESV